MGYETPQVHADLGDALARMGEFDAALVHLDRASRLAPAEDGLAAKRASLAAFLDKCREKAQCLEVSIAQAPGIPALRFKLAMVYEKQGKISEAKALYEDIRAEIGPSTRKLYKLVRHRLAVLENAEKVNPP